jgi:hypothetical protein
MFHGTNVGRSIRFLKDEWCAACVDFSEGSRGATWSAASLAGDVERCVGRCGGPP